MRFSCKKKVLTIPEKSSAFDQNYPCAAVEIERGKSGFPRIKARDKMDAFFGLGYMHAYDRMFQVQLIRILSSGRMTECFGERPGLLELDRYFKTYPFRRTEAGEFDRLSADSGAVLKAYIAGINTPLAEGYRPLEMRLLGIKAEEWEYTDMAALLRIMAYVGLANMGASVKEDILSGIAGDKGRFTLFGKLFPDQFKNYDPSWLSGLIFTLQRNPADLIESAGGSNNWAASGRLCSEGRPLFCNDPHLEVSRLPSLWYEAVLRSPDFYCAGVGIPGGAAVASGCTGALSWGITFGAADTEDFFLEDCKDGAYLCDGRRFDFRRREERIQAKNGKTYRFTVFENDHGILQGNPELEGRLLCRKWIGFSLAAAASVDAFCRLTSAKTVREGMACVENVEIFNLNWVFTDSEGNIGYRMSGAVPVRGRGLSGLLPIPGWRSEFDWQGQVEASQMPSSYNPDCGYIVTANNRITNDNGPPVQTLPLSADRAERIRELLSANTPLDIRKMQEIQYDVFSLEAERVLSLLEPYLQQSERGRKLLNWDRKFTPESRQAAVYDMFYRELIIELCSGLLFDAEEIERMYDGRFFFFVNHRRIEEEWGKGKGLFAGVDRQAAVNSALNRIPHRRPPRWGRRNRLHMRHLLFGKTPVGFLWNAGPFEFRGHFSTVHQGSAFKRGTPSAGTAGPSYHQITDLKAGRYYSNMPGGASGRPFSRLYRRGIREWLYKKYFRIDFKAG